LVNPVDMGCQWDSSNLIFRSSVWDSEGNLVSAGFKKFFNLFEKPELSPGVEELSDAEIIEKIDGSCLIISRYKDRLIIRTRGTFTTDNLPNADDIRT
jgi:hypothetical protein